MSQLWLHPGVPGSGKRLFDHHDRHRGPVELRFVDSTVTGGGLVILTYERT